MIYNISLWPAVVEDIKVTLGYVHITNSEEVTLEFIHKEEMTEKVTKDYCKLNMSAMWLKDVPKNDTITLKVKAIILFGNVVNNVYHHIQITPTIVTGLVRNRREEAAMGNHLKVIQYPCNGLLSTILIIAARYSL